MDVEGQRVPRLQTDCLLLRTYCETDIDPSHRKYSQLQAAIRYLQGKEPDLECTMRDIQRDSSDHFSPLIPLVCCLGDEALLQQLLFDAVVTAPLEAYWNTLMLSDRSRHFDS